MSGGKALQTGRTAWAKALMRTSLVRLRDRQKTDMAGVWLSSGEREDTEKKPGGTRGPGEGV